MVKAWVFANIETVAKLVMGVASQEQNSASEERGDEDGHEGTKPSQDPTQRAIVKQTELKACYACTCDSNDEPYLIESKNYGGIEKTEDRVQISLRTRSYRKSRQQILARTETNVREIKPNLIHLYYVDNFDLIYFNEGEENDLLAWQ